MDPLAWGMPPMSQWVTHNLPDNWFLQPCMWPLLSGDSWLCTFKQASSIGQADYLPAP